MQFLVTDDGCKVHCMPVGLTNQAHLSELFIQTGHLPVGFHFLIMGIRVPEVAEVEQYGRKFCGSRLQRWWQRAAKLEELRKEGMALAHLRRASKHMKMG